MGKFKLLAASKKGLATASVAVFLAMGSTSASASVIYDLAVPNAGIAAYPGPYGKVEVALLDTNTAQITLTGLTQGIYSYLFGGQGTLGLNTNGLATLVGGSIVGTQPGVPIPDDWVIGDTVSDGAGNISTFGNFNFSLKTFDGASHALLTLAFQIDKNAGTWTSDADILTPNSNGYSAVGHVFVFTDQYTLNPVTGFAGDGEICTDCGQDVPEPGSFSLLLIGLLGLGGLAFAGARRARV